MLKWQYPTVIKRSKDYEKRGPVTVFLSSYRWLSRKALVLQPSDLNRAKDIANVAIKHTTKLDCSKLNLQQIKQPPFSFPFLLSLFLSLFF